MEYRYRDASEMKDSGVEWIGKIPNDWKIKSVKYLVDKNEYYPIGDGDHGSIKPEMYKQEGIPYIRVQNLTWGNKLDFTNMVYISKEVNEQNRKSILKPKDILIAKTGATVGKTAIIPDSIIEANTTSSVGKVTVNHKKISYKYVAYYFQSKSFITQINLTAYQKSAQPGFNIDDLVDYKVSIPQKYDDQEKIANFLDKKTSQFNSIISKKEALIEKLEEAKKSLISEVVTGKVKVVKTDDGYDLVKRSSDEVKDSGVEWLGEIPKDWEVKRIKYLFEIKKNIAGKLGYDVLSVTQSGIKIKDITKNEGQLSMDYSKYQTVDIGDFVMNHMDLLTGFVDCSKYIGVTSPDYRVFRLLNNYDSKNYYNYIFQFCYYNKVFYSLGQGVSSMGRWRLQTETFKNFMLPKPPIREQEELAKILEYKIKEIEMLKNKLILNIQKLKEAKQSLISEAVTGKIEILD